MATNLQDPMCSNMKRLQPIINKNNRQMLPPPRTARECVLLPTWRIGKVFKGLFSWWNMKNFEQASIYGKLPERYVQTYEGGGRLDA